MADQDDRHAGLLLQRAQEVEDLGLDRDVERGGGLVGDEELGAPGQGHGDRHALRHAARNLVGVPPGDGGVERNGLQELPGAGLRVPAADPLVRAHRLGDLRSHPEGRVERDHRLLGDHRDPRAPHVPEPRVRHADQLLIAQPDGSRGDPAVLAEEPEERERGDRLPAARFAHEPHDLAREDVEVDALDHGRLGAAGTESDGQPAHREQGARPRLAEVGPRGAQLGAGYDRLLPGRAGGESGSGEALLVSVAQCVAEEAQRQRRDGDDAAGRDEQPRVGLDEGGGLGHHSSPRGRGRRRPEGEEREAGLDAEGRRREERDLHEQHAAELRQHVVRHDPELAQAGDACGPDVELGAHRERRAAEHADERSAGEDADADHRDEHAVVEDREHRERDDRARDREQDVDHPEDDAVEHAPEVAGEDAQRDREDQHGDDRDEHTAQRLLPAEEQPAQHIAAEGVGAEDVRAGGSLADDAEALLERVVGGEQRGREGRPDDHQEHDRRDQAEGLSQHAAEEPGGQRLRPRAGGRDRAGRGETAGMAPVFGEPVIGHAPSGSARRTAGRSRG
nr:hypothetical protein [Naasia aerilata]